MARSISARRVGPAWWLAALAIVVLMAASGTALQALYDRHNRDLRAHMQTTLDALTNLIRQANVDDLSRVQTIAADPFLIPDPDAGRCVELFAAGFRNGFTAQSYAENAAFAPGGPAIGTRNIYPIDFGGPNDTARDVSNNVTNRRH